MLESLESELRRKMSGWGNGCHDPETQTLLIEQIETMIAGGMDFHAALDCTKTVFELAQAA